MLPLSTGASDPASFYGGDVLRDACQSGSAETVAPDRSADETPFGFS